MEEVWSAIHNTECQLTAGLRPRNGGECCTCVSQSCKRAMLTKGLPYLTCTLLNLMLFIIHISVTFHALNVLLCAAVPLRTFSLIHNVNLGVKNYSLSQLHLCITITLLLLPLLSLFCGCRLLRPSSTTTHIYKHLALQSLVIWWTYRVGFCQFPNCSMVDGSVGTILTLLLYFVHLIRPAMAHWLVLWLHVK